ncbi:alpha-1,6-mannosyl-glycoprotein 4-beta-N-acetylglucosaminyltransferase-like isoform X2 [Rhopilema esculentum]|uniref:alpha-1,6-mannosyl-glycoprotein 4-beta-N-acetylglucosaminyltransferase-like isoform X2 n=1 Tax=Rhopilema esculentum TaxID=499914 RepID=UPI0031E2422A
MSPSVRTLCLKQYVENNFTMATADPRKKCISTSWHLLINHAYFVATHPIALRRLLDPQIHRKNSQDRGRDKGKQREGKSSIGSDENNVEEPLPLPDLVKENSLLLGKRLPKKVSLAVAMLLRGSCCGWYQFTKAVRQIAEQDPKREGAQSLVVVLLLAETRKTKAKEIVVHIQSEINDLVKSGYVQLVVSRFDVDPNYFERVRNADLKEVSSTISLINYRIAFLLKYCLEVADHAFMVDSDSAIGIGAINTVFKEMDNMKPNTLHVEFEENSFFTMLFNGRYLPRVYGTFYAMAQLGRPIDILKTIAFVSVHTDKYQYIGDPILTKVRPESSNPPATIETNLLANGVYNAENAYLGKGFSWFITPKKGNYLTIKFKNPSRLKTVYIESGFDISGRDSLTEALLEFSYSQDQGECTQYEVVASFNEVFFVELSKEASENEKHFSKPILCIRIRITEDFVAWASIKNIVLLEDK